MLPRQWVGMVLVFLGLGLDTYFGKATKKQHHHDTLDYPQPKEKQLEVTSSPV